MPDQTAPIVRSFSVADLPNPEVIRDRAIAATGAVSFEQACANVRKFVETASAAMASNRLAERPPFEVVKHGYRRSCASCGFHQVAHVGVTAEAQHICLRDGVTYLIMWPRG